MKIFRWETVIHVYDNMFSLSNNGKKKLDYFHLCLILHARIQEFSSGVSRPVWPKKLWQRFFFFLLFFFLVLSLFNRSQMVNFKEIYHFSRFQRGSNIFHGGGGGGVQLLIPYRNPYNLWFSRGGPDPLSPPLWIRTWFCFSCLI